MNYKQLKIPTDIDLSWVHRSKMKEGKIISKEDNEDLIRAKKQSLPLIKELHKIWKKN